METDGKRRARGGTLGQYGRVLRRAADAEAVAEAEREVGAAWTAELLQLRDAAMDHIEAAQSLLDIVAEELGSMAEAADERDRALRAGRERVEAARQALERGAGQVEVREPWPGGTSRR
jgi:hypothetical protein